MIPVFLQFDKDYKKTQRTNNYTLKCFRFLFLFHDRREGIISKVAFWFNIFYFTHICVYIIIFITYVVLTTVELLLVLELIIISYYIMAFALVIFTAVFAEKARLTKAQQKYQEGLKYQREAEDWLKKRAEQQQHKETNPSQEKSNQPQGEKQDATTDEIVPIDFD